MARSAGQPALQDCRACILKDVSLRRAVYRSDWPDVAVSDFGPSTRQGGDDSCRLCRSRQDILKTAQSVIRPLFAQLMD